MPAYCSLLRLLVTCYYNVLNLYCEKGEGGYICRLLLDRHVKIVRDDLYV